MKKLIHQNILQMVTNCVFIKQSTNLNLYSSRFFKSSENDRLTYRKQRGFTWVELLIVIVIIGILNAIAIPADVEYQRRARWSQTLYMITKPLQTAISNCLKANKGNSLACNDFSPNKLAKYGVTAVPQANGNFLAVAVLKNNAGIRIIGSKCIVELLPKIGESPAWELSLPFSEYNSVKQCQCLLKQVAAKNFQFHGCN